MPKNFEHTQITSTNTTITPNSIYPNNTIPNTTILFSSKNMGALVFGSLIGILGGCMLFAVAIPCLCKMGQTGAIYNLNEGTVDHRGMLARDQAQEAANSAFDGCYNPKKACIVGAVIGGGASLGYVISDMQNSDTSSSSSSNHKTQILTEDNFIEYNNTILDYDYMR